MHTVMSNDLFVTVTDVSKSRGNFCHVTCLTFISTSSV